MPGDENNFESQTWIMKHYAQITMNLDKAFASFDELPGQNKNISFRLTSDKTEEKFQRENPQNCSKVEYEQFKVETRIY